MKKLIQIEWIKARNYASFRLFVLMHFILFLLVLFIGSRIDISVPGFSVRKVYQFPYVWSSFTWLAGSGFFNLLLAIPVLVLAGNEFVFQTNKTQLFAGLGRNELFSSKLLLIGGLALYGLLLVFISSLVSGFIFTRDVTVEMVFGGAWMVLMYFLKAVAVMIFAYLLAVTFRNNALSIVMFLLYFIMIEPILRRFFPPDARLWFPARVIGHLTPVPEFFSIASGNKGDAQNLTFESIGLAGKNLPVIVNTLMALMYSAVFAFLAWWQIRKKDL